MIKKLSLSASLAYLASLFSPTIAIAQSVGTLNCNDTGGVSTAIGCVSTDPQLFAGDILRFAVGIGGGFALLLILFGFFLLATSGGNPDKVNAAKEIITSAIAGLIFVTMATVLMSFIGINILALPGLE